jgi:hypothetical protein
VGFFNLGKSGCLKFDVHIAKLEYKLDIGTFVFYSFKERYGS